MNGILVLFFHLFEQTFMLKHLGVAGVYRRAGPDVSVPPPEEPPRMDMRLAFQLPDAMSFIAWNDVVYGDSIAANKLRIIVYYHRRV